MTTTSDAKTRKGHQASPTDRQARRICRYSNASPRSEVASVVVTFDPPAAGQAIPDPFPGSVHVFGGGQLLGLIGPAR
jgi:hypothetical protein